MTGNRLGPLSQARGNAWTATSQVLRVQSSACYAINALCTARFALQAEDGREEGGLCPSQHSSFAMTTQATALTESLTWLEHPAKLGWGRRALAHTHHPPPSAGRELGERCERDRARATPPLWLGEMSLWKRGPWGSDPASGSQSALRSFPLAKNSGPGALSSLSECNVLCHSGAVSGCAQRAPAPRPRQALARAYPLHQRPGAVLPS